MTPIPSALLPHSISLSKFLAENFWGESSFSTPIEVKNVRVQVIDKLTSSSSSNDIISSALLIFDCKNSSPLDVTFNYRDLVSFNGLSFFVSSFKYIFDDKFLHHVEIGLSNWSIRQT